MYVTLNKSDVWFREMTVKHGFMKCKEVYGYMEYHWCVVTRYNIDLWFICNNIDARLWEIDKRFQVSSAFEEEKKLALNDHIS